MKPELIKKNAGEIIKENLNKNVELYNKYAMILASIFISGLTAIGEHNNFNSWLKFSIICFSLSLSSALMEFSVLIINDSIVLKIIKNKFLTKISHEKYSSLAIFLAIFSFVTFLLGIIVVDIFILTLKG